jgi:hypothetical protein
MSFDFHRVVFRLRPATAAISNHSGRFAVLITFEADFWSSAKLVTIAGFWPHWRTLYFGFRAWIP